MPTQSPSMTHLGINIYHRCRQMPTEFLSQTLLPLIDFLRRRSSSVRFWYTFFDARGPHIFVLFSIPSGLVKEAREKIERALSLHLRRSPPEIELSEDEVRIKHLACRDKALSQIDRQPDLAAPNSFIIFEQPASHYPFSTMAGLANQQTLWRQCDRLCTWTLGQLFLGQGTRAAISWMAAVDRALKDSAMEACSYWRCHAESLIPALAEQPRWDPKTSTTLSQALGVSNLRTFASHWNTTSAPEMPEARRALDLLSTHAELSQEQVFAPLREINHLVLLQLGLPVRAHIPLVLYACARHYHA